MNPDDIEDIEDIEYDEDLYDEDFDYEPESPESLLRWYHSRVL